MHGCHNFSCSIGMLCDIRDSIGLTESQLDFEKKEILLEYIYRGNKKPVRSL
jgi:hypothetical protein